MKTIGGIPRRIRIDRFIPAETVIRRAILTVEECGAHPLLTEAVILLGQAQEKVADWFDSHSDIISPVCESTAVGADSITDACGKATVAGYPAMGGGYMALCREHAVKHESITQPIEEILAGVPHPLAKQKEAGT